MHSSLYMQNADKCFLDFDLLGHRIVAGEGLHRANGAKLSAEKVSPTRIRFAFSTSLTSEEALLVLSLKLPLPLWGEDS